MSLMVAGTNRAGGYSVRQTIKSGMGLGNGEFLPDRSQGVVTKSL